MTLGDSGSLLVEGLVMILVTNAPLKDGESRIKIAALDIGNRPTYKEYKARYSLHDVA